MNMEFLKQVLKDASVQCEQMVRPSGPDSSTSTDDFEIIFSHSKKTACLISHWRRVSWVNQ